jgi:hypothetical protein
MTKKAKSSATDLQPKQFIERWTREVGEQPTPDQILDMLAQLADMTDAKLNTHLLVQENNLLKDYQKAASTEMAADDEVLSEYKRKIVGLRRERIELWEALVSGLKTAVKKKNEITPTIDALAEFLHSTSRRSRIVNTAGPLDEQYKDHLLETATSVNDGETLALYIEHGGELTDGLQDYLAALVRKFGPKLQNGSDPLRDLHVYRTIEYWRQEVIDIPVRKEIEKLGLEGVEAALAFIDMDRLPLPSQQAAFRHFANKQETVDDDDAEAEDSKDGGKKTAEIKDKDTASQNIFLTGKNVTEETLQKQYERGRSIANFKN